MDKNYYDKIGRFIVAQGRYLGVNKLHRAWYDFIVIDEHGTVLGVYGTFGMAMDLARGLDKKERFQMDKELHNLLLDEKTNEEK